VDGADVVIEASGSPAAVAEGLQLVRTRGRYIVPGQYSRSGGIEIEPSLITFRALRITGSGQYKLGDIGAYLQFVASHPDLHELFARAITHRYPVRRAEEALADVAAGRVVKAVLVRELLGD
jgi:threonine dehydrogenase-like Zn-dependent dehydrogenase